MAVMLRKCLPILVLVTAVSPGGQAQVVFQGEGVGEPVELRDVRVRDQLYPVDIQNWWGYMNKRGHLVIIPQFDWADYFYGGLARAVVAGGTGFVKRNGDWYIKPRFIYADRFQEGFAVVGDGERFGFIHKSERVRVPIRFDGALRFREKLAAVMLDGRCGFVNVWGRFVVDLQFARVRSFHEGKAVVKLADDYDENGPLGYINKRGKIVFLDRRHAFDDLGDFHDGLARAKVGDAWGYIGKSFGQYIKPRFEDARDFTNGMAAVKLNDKWGFIGKTGKLLVHPRFDFADDFDNKHAMIKVDEKCGYVDKIGNYRIMPQFDHAEPFFRKYARVTQAPSFAYIDVAGRVVWDPCRFADEGIVDVRIHESIRIGTAERSRYHRKVRPPPARDSVAIPYPPEYLYDEVLPQPA